MVTTTATIVTGCKIQVRSDRKAKDWHDVAGPLPWESYRTWLGTVRAANHELGWIKFRLVDGDRREEDH